MQPHTFTFDRGPNCLFKWQVIPGKQITTADASAGVVFLQQTVANKELGLLFDWINPGYRGVEERIRRMSIVSNTQDDLL